MKTVNFISHLPTLIVQMDSSLEEISESLHGFCRKFVAADAKSHIPYQTTNYRKPGGEKLQNPLGFKNIKENSNFNFKFVIFYLLISREKFKKKTANM